MEHNSPQTVQHVGSEGVLALMALPAGPGAVAVEGVTKGVREVKWAAVIATVICPDQTQTR